MRNFEYLAVPAPTRASKAKGLKTTEDRFALSMTETLNEMAEEGWEYVRADTLPCEERKGLTGTQTVYQNVLVFRRFNVEAKPLPLESPMVAEPAPRRPITSRPPEPGIVTPLSARRDE